MIKNLLLCVLFVACVYIGRKIRDRYKQRERVAEDTVAFITEMKRACITKRLTVAEATEEFLNNSKPSAPFISLLGSLKNNVVEKDGKPVADFLDALSAQYKLEPDFFDAHTADATAILNTRKKDRKEKGELYQKLFVVAGLALVIILI